MITHRTLSWFFLLAIGGIFADVTRASIGLQDHIWICRNSIVSKILQNHWIDGLTSRLHLTNAHLSDSGNYSCVPTIAGATSVNVHVINGEHPAAMQHGNKNTASLSLSLHGTLVYTFFVVIIKHIR